MAATKEMGEVNSCFLLVDKKQENVNGNKRSKNMCRASLRDCTSPSLDESHVSNPWLPHVPGNQTIL